MTAIAVAQGTLNKDLCFNIDLVGYICNLRKRQLPCENNAAEAHLFHRPRALNVVDAHLSAGMDNEIGEIVSDN